MVSTTRIIIRATDYGREVDVWGVGCLLIELYCKMAAFRGMDEVSQLCRILILWGLQLYKLA